MSDVQGAKIMMSDRSPITRFEILGLYGDRDITLEFTSSIKILVDENGSGKTTVLNTLFNILSGHWGRLAELEFEEIRVHFPNDKVVSVEHRACAVLLKETEIRENLKDIFGYTISDNHETLLEQTIIPRTHRFQEDVDPFTLDYISEVNILLHNVHQKKEHIKALFPCAVLYFPTYRRVEEDLHRLGYVEADLDNDEQLIHFGMGDVKRRFERITDDIRDSSVEWYSIINGRMLTQLIEGPQLDESALNSLNNPDALRIVLDRVGEHIPQSDKERLLELVHSGEIKLPQYKTLAYFLSNLLQVYEQQQEKDHAIKNFARVANGYLEDKEVRYNESKVDVQIINKRSGQKVALEKLSSGEKQIISIFSRLYLEESSPVAILFDEPELSLSMEWQKTLLQDIVDSGKCAFLLAATHSPFIFDNRLDQFASVLNISYREYASSSKS
ncbi:MAG: AAA family ATPase [Ardenticatenaceae bacterium]